MTSPVLYFARCHPTEGLENVVIGVWGRLGTGAIGARLSYAFRLLFDKATFSSLRWIRGTDNNR